MPTFSNMKQLSKYLQKNCANLQLANGKTMKQVMKEEAEYLRKLLVEEIERVYNSYDPKVYRRTMGLLESLRVDPVIQNGNELSVRLWFDEKALHPSMFKDGNDGFVPILIDQGWQVKSGWHRNIPHFGFRPPSHFVRKAVEEYHRTSKYGFRIEVTYDPPRGSSWVEKFEGNGASETS